MGGNDDEITDFLDRYAATLTTYDAHAAAALWATPGMIIDDNFAGVLNSRDEMIAGLEQSYPLYQKLGLDSVGYELLDRRPLSSTITQVQVRWLFNDADGNQLTDSDSHYIIRRDSDGLHAYVCIENDAAAKLQALCAEKGIDFPGATAS